MHGFLSSSFCVVLSCVGRGLCDGLITRPNEFYQVSKVEQKTSGVRRPRSVEPLMIMMMMMMMSILPCTDRAI
jgi:hypothetical protein